MKKNIYIVGVTTIVFFIGLFLLWKYAIKVPSIELVGGKVKYLEINGSCDMPGYTFVDKDDEGTNVIIQGEVDCSKLGEYKIKYSINKLFKSREYEQIVHVIDTTGPVIKYDGKQKVYLAKKSNKSSCLFKHPNMTVTDNSGEDVQLSISEHVNLCQPGDYRVTYTALDKSGNRTRLFINYVVFEEIDSVELTVIVDILNIRDDHYTVGNIIDTIKHGDNVIAFNKRVDESNREWYQIEHNGKTGWIAGWYTIKSFELIDGYYVADMEKDDLISGYRITEVEYDPYSLTTLKFDVNKEVNATLIYYEDQDVSSFVLDTPLLHKNLIFSNGPDYQHKTNFNVIQLTYDSFNKFKDYMSDEYHSKKFKVNFDYCEFYAFYASEGPFSRCNFNSIEELE